MCTQRHVRTRTLATEAMIDGYVAGYKYNTVVRVELKILSIKKKKKNKYATAHTMHACILFIMHMHGTTGYAIWVDGRLV